MLAQDRAETPDHPRSVLVPADQEATLRHQVDAKRVDANRAQLAHQNGAGELMAAHANRD